MAVTKKKLATSGYAETFYIIKYRNATYVISYRLIGKERIILSAIFKMTNLLD